MVVKNLQTYAVYTWATLRQRDPVIVCPEYSTRSINTLQLMMDTGGGVLHGRHGWSGCWTRQSSDVDSGAVSSIASWIGQQAESKDTTWAPRLEGAEEPGQTQDSAGQAKQSPCAARKELLMMLFASVEPKWTSYSCRKSDCHHFKGKNQPQLFRWQVFYWVLHWP